MRIAIFSDIHGNLPALEVVLEHIRAQQPDAVYCLGDLVGYAPFPNEVIERIRRDVIPTIMGNYDDGVGFDRDDCGCAYRDADERQRGDQSLAWTRAHVTADHKAFLRTLHSELRFTADGKRVLLVHGSPRKMNEYLFEDRPLSSFQRLVDGVWFVNAGSVGKPKDGDWRAGYILVEPTRANPVQFIRLPYDVATVAAAIRNSDLPDEFATDIETGGTPTSPPASQSG